MEKFETAWRNTFLRRFEVAICALCYPMQYNRPSTFQCLYNQWIDLGRQKQWWNKKNTWKQLDLPKSNGVYVV